MSLEDLPTIGYCVFLKGQTCALANGCRATVWGHAVDGKKGL
jgi:hypothetical protein